MIGQEKFYVEDSETKINVAESARRFLYITGLNTDALEGKINTSCFFAYIHGGQRESISFDFHISSISVNQFISA